MESQQNSWCWMFMDGELSKEEIEYFLAIGAIEFDRINLDGSETYRLTEEAKELTPEFYERQMKHLNSVIFSLWNKDLISLTFDDEGEPLIILHENTGEMIKSLELSEDESEIMEAIILSWYLDHLE
jgi:hypothetical protein